MGRLREVDKEVVREGESANTTRGGDSELGMCDIPVKEDFDQLMQGGRVSLRECTNQQTLGNHNEVPTRSGRHKGQWKLGWRDRWYTVKPDGRSGWLLLG